MTFISASKRFPSSLTFMAMQLATMLFLVLASSTIGQERAGEGPCLDCHGDMAQGVVVHAAVEMEACETCHLATGEGHAFVAPKSQVATCLECHDDPRLEAGHAHGPVATGECQACHAPHRSEHAKLLWQEIPDLCWNCHGAILERPGGSPVRNVRREIANAAFKHDALEAGGCDVCHPAHVASGEGFFSDTFPAGPYAVGHQGTYDLCFGCHDEEMLSDDPQSTGFRQGDQLNLHAAHVALPKSRSCALCHSPHGGGDHLIRSWTLFGTWDMPITYEASSDGGSCAPACHEPRKYQRTEEPRPGTVEALPDLD